jgi:hypothetical protein
VLVAQAQLLAELLAVVTVAMAVQNPALPAAVVAGQVAMPVMVELDAVLVVQAQPQVRAAVAVVAGRAAQVKAQVVAVA